MDMSLYEEMEVRDELIKKNKEGDSIVEQVNKLMSEVRIKIYCSVFSWLL